MAGEVKLTDLQSAILRVLDLDGGYTISRISERVDHPYCEFNKRQRSGAIRSNLSCLLKQGLVRLLDNEKPAAWCVTPAGRAALKSGGKA